MKFQYKYPDFPDFKEKCELLIQYSKLKAEYGSDINEITMLLNEADEFLKSTISRLKQKSECNLLKSEEPDILKEIKALRPKGIRKFTNKFDKNKYMNKLKGSLMGRFAGCTLGAPVEFWSIKAMEEWAQFINDDFPPKDYWSDIKNPSDKRYEVSRFKDYTRSSLTFVPVDDDITYTILGLLILEEYGPHFTTEDVADSWVKLLPHACTAEAITLRNLKKGVSPLAAGDTDNPYVQWIGADIRSDPWGYAAPGLPEMAAELAYRDSFLSHRRNGIYGAMFFSSAIASAFETKNSEEALTVALTEIPKNCLLYRDISWALDLGANIKNYADATEAIQHRFKGMGGAHTNLNACLTIFGLMIGKDDFTKVIGETVAMGYDNDCNAATAGSIAGAVLGIEAIPEYWYKPFNNKVLTYINGYPEFYIDNLMDRFCIQAEKVFSLL